MSIDKATPRPWAVDLARTSAIFGNGTFTASTNITGWDVDTYNAELIVRAVNSYDAMVEALEALITSHVDLVSSGDCGCWDVETEDAMIQARTALKLARGEQ